jgi:UDP-2,4-diacetamido-2,4,6-trideoxy-beta-L-altropyranose hydrolase
MDPGTLLIRADSNVAIGTGHVMRCLALAQAWQDAGGKAVFAMAECTPAVLERLRRENIQVTQLEVGSLASDASQVIALAVRHSASWVVVDGYQFDGDYQRTLKGAGLKVLLVDDLGRLSRYSADLVLNQNVHADGTLYRNREAHTCLLLGPRYALLRREFTAQSVGRREVPDVARRMLVTMGGSDPDNATIKVVQAVGELADVDLEVRVIVGGSNPHMESLERAVQPHRDRVQLLRDVTNMPQSMVWADLAVANAGTISWELCFFGLPAMVVDLADNQRPVAQALEERGAAVHLQNLAGLSTAEIAQRIRSLLKNKAARTKLSMNARQLVDGKGTERVMLVLKSYEIGLRRAREEDRELLWKWANDPDVRSASFSTAEILWDEHVAWFANKLRDKNASLFIALDREGEPIGQIRLDRVGGGEAEIDISVAREQRGRGCAALLISRASQMAFSEIGLTRLHAFVKHGNQASGRAFGRADFVPVNDVEVRGSPAAHYVREREW